MAEESLLTRGRDPEQPNEFVDEITLDGRRVLLQCVDLPLAEVLLDPMNPRLANTARLAIVGAAQNVQEELSRLLWSDPGVRDLYQSVLGNGGLVERIIVRSNGVVAEGNCRTVVYNKLLENTGSVIWKKIPAWRLPPDVTERQVAVLLGEIHVGGKNKWPAFEKAGHIYKLIHEFGITQDEIARLLKSSKSAVNQSNRAFAAMVEKYLPKYPGVAAVRKFSHFVELFKSPELRQWVTNDEGALDEFVDWVGSGKIEKGADVRHLVDYVRTPRALEALRAKGPDAAKEALNLDRPELTSPLFKAMVEMTEAFNAARLDEIQRVRNAKTEGTVRIVRELQASLERFVDLIDGV
jgi:hypothetical protein